MKLPRLCLFLNWEGRVLLITIGQFHLLLPAVSCWNILFRVLSEFLETNSLLISCQHGCRKGLSNVIQVIELTHCFSSILNGEGQVEVIFLDFCKAFDKVNHWKLNLMLGIILKNREIISYIQRFLHDH